MYLSFRSLAKNQELETRNYWSFAVSQTPKTKHPEPHMRVVYKEEGDIITVITSYWTSKIEKYWEEKT